MITTLNAEQTAAHKKMTDSKSYQNQLASEQYGKLPYGECEVVDITTIKIEGSDADLPCYTIANKAGDKGNLFLSQFLEITIDDVKECVVLGTKPETKNKAFIIPRKRSTKSVKDFETLYKHKFTVSKADNGSKLAFVKGLSHDTKNKAIEYFNEKSQVQTMYQFEIERV
jgi:hypothetical protein